MKQRSITAGGKVRKKWKEKLVYRSLFFFNELLLCIVILFFSFLALSMALGALPSTSPATPPPAFFAAFAVFLSYRSVNLLLSFFCALLANLSASILLIFFLSSCGSAASASASCAWCATLAAEGALPFAPRPCFGSRGAAARAGRAEVELAFETWAPP